MKTLKITLILALFIATLSSCTKQDLTEDDVLRNTSTPTLFTGGAVDETGN
jgi:hypothetical protein